jgi:uncharacterized protein
MTPTRARPLLRAALLAVAVGMVAVGLHNVLARVPPRGMEVARIAVVTADGAAHPFTVEVARTPAQIARGLMYREHLAPDAGMLFLYPAPRDDIRFWMKNTRVPLDMLFLAPGGGITRIHPRAQPGDEAPVHAGPGVAAVLELPGGTAARLGIAVGDRVEARTF